MSDEIDYAGIMNACRDKDHEGDLSAMNDIERVVYLVSTLEFEVALGGLSTFYWNSAGDHAPEMVDALRRIGLPNAAAALAEANALMQRERTTWPDRETRIEQLDSMNYRDFTPFEDTVDGRNDVFNDDVGVQAFIRKHLDQLPPPKPYVEPPTKFKDEFPFG